MPIDTAILMMLGAFKSPGHVSGANSATPVIRRKHQSNDSDPADSAPDLLDLHFQLTDLGSSAGTRTHKNFASHSASSAVVEWQASDTGATVGWKRLQEVRSLLGSGEWRTGRLAPYTLEMAETFFGTFAAMVPDLEPRVAPTDGGGIMFEWENGDRELLVEVRADGVLDVLQVVGDEQLEHESTLDDAAALATWLIGF